MIKYKHIMLLAKTYKTNRQTCKKAPYLGAFLWEKPFLITLASTITYSSNTYQRAILDTQLGAWY